MTDRQTSGFENGKIMSEMESRPKSVSSRASFEAEKNSDLKEVRLRKLMQLLTSDIPGLANDVINDLDDDQRNKKVSKPLESENDQLKRENDGLLLQIQELELKVSPTNQTEKHRVDQLEKQVLHEQRKRAEAEKKIIEVKTTNAELLQSCQDELHKSQKETEQHKKYILRQEQEIARYKSRNDHYDRTENELQRPKETLKKKDDELEDYRTRLSRQMGDKLTDNKPNVADLSDKNRPTKLAEQYQEIYDNEWTDAYETLDNGNEEKTIASLINILQEARKFCDDEAEKQMAEIQNALTQGSSLVMEGSRIHVPTGVKNQLDDCRKSLAEHSGKQMYQRYRNTLEHSWSQTGRDALKVPKFLEACVKICWLMAVQDPPVVFGPFSQSDVDLDTDVYKAYTKSGKKIMFLVWPALYLHKDGPLMCKGIAQGKGSQRPNSTPPDGMTENAKSSTFKPLAVLKNDHDLAANKRHASNEKEYHKRSGTYESHYMNEKSYIPRYESSTPDYKSGKQGFERSRYEEGSVVESSFGGYEPDLSSYDRHYLGYSSHTRGYKKDTFRYKSGTEAAECLEPGTKDFDTSTRKYSSDARPYLSRTPNTELVTANYQQAVVTKRRSSTAKKIKHDPHKILWRK